MSESTIVDLVARDEAMRDTAQHIRRVGSLVNDVAYELTTRAVHHDQTKWSVDEWPYFATATSKLKGITYGTPEYKASLDSLRPAIDHHQKHNRHHPEANGKGILGMNLLDLMEMLADWKAAGERHKDGSLAKSLEINRERFAISDDLMQVLVNTAAHLGWA